LITYFIIGINVVLSLYCFSKQEVLDKLLFSPYQIKEDKSQYFRFISHAFIHKDAGHLIINMLTLYFFGTELEHIFSSTEYIVFYLLAILFSSLPSYQSNKDNPNYRAVGASGAVCAVMFALVLYSPWSVVYINFFIPIYFILFAVGYLIYSNYKIKNSNDQIGHEAHMWGSIFGIAFTLITHPISMSIFMEQIKEAPFLK
jgi:membrane associated rhomboid family serine protease